MKDKLYLHKIPLESLISILEDLYEKGVNYIDITGEESLDEENPKDIIKIVVLPEYMQDEEEEDNINELEEDKFSENDINDLL